MLMATSTLCETRSREFHSSSKPYSHMPITSSSHGWCPVHQVVLWVLVVLRVLCLLVVLVGHSLGYLALPWHHIHFYQVGLYLPSCLDVHTHALL